MRIHKDIAYMVFVLLLAANAVVYWRVLKNEDRRPSFHFLDVGQGDAALFQAAGMNILTDTGPGSAIITALGSAAPNERHLDLVIITHPQADHGGGLSAVLDNYSLGALVINGQDNPEFPGWQKAIEKAREMGVPVIVVKAGDRIRYGPDHGRVNIDILAPFPEYLESAESNDAAIVQHVRTPDWTALLTADIGFNVEKVLMAEYDLKADILKVSHHGSKYSSGAEFLKEVSPRVALIGVGERNRYGHPGKETLERLDAIGARILRTDENGNVSIFRSENMFEILF